MKEGKHKDNGEGTSNSTKSENLWKDIWKLNCPNKVKLFIWKAFRDILPINHRLNIRKVLTALGWLKEGKHKDNGEGISNSIKSENLWKDIWKLNYPKKVELFIWKAYRDKLPTNHHLNIRKVLTEDSCPLCGRWESLGYIL